jgi:hypothetical protein
LGVQTLGGLRMLKIYLMYLGNLEKNLLSPLSILSKDQHGYGFSRGVTVTGVTGAGAVLDSATP